MKKLKVCGMKYYENIKEIAKLQPDYLGFIFYEKSPRNFSGTIPSDISKNIKKVGVFVNKPITELITIINTHKLDAIQLHGEESATYVQELNSVLNDVEIIKVFGIKGNFDFSILKTYEPYIDMFLFDTKAEKRGGNGITFNWEILQGYSSNKPYLLSGGISLDNINSLQVFLQQEYAKQCIGVDINSKFEIEAGLKSVEKIRTFKTNLN